MIENIVLASGSHARQNMLKNAGVKFSAKSADIDEKTLIIDLFNQGISISEIALKLSKEKALSISENNINIYVIGSDQICDIDGKFLMKANNKKDAFDKLSRLQGHTHQLHSAVSVVKDGNEIWSHIETVHMKMKKMSHQEIENYLDVAGDDAVNCAGGYAIEKYGIRLFDKIDGDYFSILGMPLLPLLNFLEKEGAIS